jgi:hypothetical protein
MEGRRRRPRSLVVRGHRQRPRGPAFDPRAILDHDKLVASVTVDSIRQTAHKYLNLNQYVMGVLYPETP